MELAIITAGAGLVYLAGVADKKIRKTWVKRNVAIPVRVESSNAIGGKFLRK